MWLFYDTIDAGAANTHSSASAYGAAPPTTVAHPSCWKLTWRGSGATDTGVAQPRSRRRRRARDLAKFAGIFGETSGAIAIGAAEQACDVSAIGAADQICGAREIGAAAHRPRDQFSIDLSITSQFIKPAVFRKS